MMDGFIAANPALWAEDIGVRRMSAIATVDFRAGTRAAPTPTRWLPRSTKVCSARASSLVTGHGVDVGPGRAGAGREPGVLRAARRREAAVFGARGWARLDRAGRGGQRLRRGHRDPTGSQGEFQPRRRDRDGRPRRRPNLVRAQRLAGRGAVLQRLVNEYTAAMRRLSDDLLALFAARARAAATTRSWQWPTGRPGR